jgi:3-hydroxybutyryl-CoA dehydratase
VKFAIGDKASIKKTFSQEEIKSYSESSMDNNPIHYDFVFASKTIFKKPIVQGMLAASLFGGLLGSVLPGKGTIHLGQELKFLLPIFVDELVIATIIISEIRKDKPIIVFNCQIFKEDGRIATEGKAIVMYKGEYFR